MSVEVIFRYGSGEARLLVPGDVAVGELLPEFIEVAGAPAKDGEWALALQRGAELPGERTLEDCGVGDGAVLVLRERGRSEASSAESNPGPGGRPSIDRAPILRPVGGSSAAPVRRPAGRTRRTSHATGRAVSERTARTLPERLTATARVGEALEALIGRAPAVVESHPQLGLLDPGMFAVPARASPLARMREAWRLSDDRQRLERMIVAAQLRRCATIAVVSPKGGVGKTTTAALLGSLLAFLRRDRVVAVDANPDWGAPGRRLCPVHEMFIDDLLSGPLGKPHPRAIERDAYLGRGPDGLMVAPAPADPQRASKLDEASYRTLFRRLGELVGTLILDCGTGLDSPAARAALACSDQLVLVTDG